MDLRSVPRWLQSIRMCLKKWFLRVLDLLVDFGDRFAYKGSDAQPGKLGEGGKNGQDEQEAVEEGEKAGGNEAAVETGLRAGNLPQTLGVDCNEINTPSGS